MPRCILFDGIIDIDCFMALIQIQREATSSVNLCRGPGIGLIECQVTTKYGYLLDSLDLKLIFRGVIALINVVVQVLVNQLLGILLEVTPRIVSERGL